MKVEIDLTKSEVNKLRRLIGLKTQTRADVVLKSYIKMVVKDPDALELYNMKEVKEAKKKIEMLTNHLLDSIDVDLLSDSQKIAYLKAIQPFVMPKLQDVKQQTSFDVSENLEWLIDSDEKEIERNIHRELGIGTYTGDEGLA